MYQIQSLETSGNWKLLPQICLKDEVKQIILDLLFKKEYNILE
jgi:hypothetical protein